MHRRPGVSLRTDEDELRYDIAARFWAKVERGDNCWLWRAALSAEGYGTFGIGKRTAVAHRVAYELNIGRIPDGLVLDHLCRNRGCVNPDHLEVVDDRTNIIRGVGPTARNHAKTKCSRGHNLTGSNLHLENGKRRCRACGAENSKRRYHSKLTPEQLQLINLMNGDGRELSDGGRRAIVARGIFSERGLDVILRNLGSKGLIEVDRVPKLTDHGVQAASCGRHPWREVVSDGE